jgi:hypothetical protein
MSNCGFLCHLRKAKEKRDERKSLANAGELPYLGKLIKATFIFVYNFDPVLRLIVSPLQRLAKGG